LINKVEKTDEAIKKILTNESYSSNQNDCIK